MRTFFGTERFISLCLLIWNTTIPCIQAVSTSYPTSAPSLRPTPEYATFNTDVVLLIPGISTELNWLGRQDFMSISTRFIANTIHHEAPEDNDVKVRVRSVSISFQEIEEGEDEGIVYTPSRSLTSQAMEETGHDRGLSPGREKNETSLMIGISIESRVTPYSPPADFSVKDKVLYGFRYEFDVFLDNLKNESVFFQSVHQHGEDDDDVPNDDHDSEDHSDHLKVSHIVMISLICGVLGLVTGLATFRYRKQKKLKGQEEDPYLDEVADQLPSFGSISLSLSESQEDDDDDDSDDEENKVSRSHSPCMSDMTESVCRGEIT